jgi:Tol biopolymer transport system component
VPTEQTLRARKIILGCNRAAFPFVAALILLVIPAGLSSNLSSGLSVGKGGTLELSFSSVAKGERSSQLYLANPDGTNVRAIDRVRVGDKQDPDWSPDGSRVAYRWIPRGDYSYTPIIITRADGSAFLNLSRKTSLLGFAPSWSPDGKQLALAAAHFPRVAGERMGLYVVAADGSRVRKLKTIQREVQEPAWAPNGRLIAFELVSGGGFDIYTVRPDGTDLKRLTRYGDSQWPMWSPASDKIAFNRSHGAARPGVWIMNADGSDQHLLTLKWGSGVPGNWEPGSKVTFQCHPPGSAKGVVAACGIGADGKGFTVFLGGRDAGFPSWRLTRDP